MTTPVGPPEPPPVVELRDVGKSYPGGIAALQHASLVIRAEELVAIAGPSGSGKSTLLNVLGTLDRPSTGTVHINGQQTTDLSDRDLSALRGRTLGFVFQQCHLTDGLSAIDNVMTGLLYSGTARRDRRELAAAALSQVGLGRRMNHRPNELSGGERQRVAIARAIAHGPSLLLADEPTGALDSVNGRAVLDLLLALHTAGTTVAIITHDRDIADRMPRRLRVQDGRVTQDLA